MKLKLSSKLIKTAYKIFDVEASAETAVAEGRIIEYAFVIQKLSQLPKGKLLDVGCTARLNHIPATMTALGWEVWGLDLREFKFRHPNFNFVSEDITNTTFKDGFFDAICAISTLEHLGLSGRYGVTEEDLNKDTKAIREISRILRPGGTLVCTMPFARKARVIKPLQKVYDKTNLEDLFVNWVVNDMIYYELGNDGYWVQLAHGSEYRVRNSDGDSAIVLLELGLV